MADKRSKTATQDFWSNQIDGQIKNFKENWYGSGDKTVKRYRDGGQGGSSTNLNILWANTEILKAATFSRVPPPNITRRYKNVVDEDPQAKLQDAIAREGSETIEKVLEFQADEKSFTANLRKARDDFLLPGRGTVWIQYDSEFEEIQLEIMDEFLNLTAPKFGLDGVAMTPDRFIDIEGEQVAVADRFVKESMQLDYVFWKDYLHSDSRSENDVWWKARQHGLDKARMIDMFGEDVVSQIKVETFTQGDSNNNKREVFNVWEIWDKAKKERLWFSLDALDLLKVGPAPLNLTDFFPTPKSIMPFETTDTMMPIPEFLVYKDLAVELDVISTRLTSLTEALKLVGIYDTINSKVITKLGQGNDGDLMPVNMSAFKEKGSLSQQIEWVPIEKAAQVIQALEARKVVIVNEIHQITGISDIMRGSTDPRETAKAQMIKGSFGSIRLRPRREPMEELIRDVYGIMAEIIAGQFDQSTIEKITGKPVHPLVMEFIGNDEIRNFRIDVETDATVQPNQELDQQNAIEFVTLINGMFATALPAVKETPELGKLVGATMKFVGAKFKAGRELMAIFDETIDQLTKKGEQPQGQDVASQLAAQQQQVEMLKAQNDAGKVAVENRKVDAQGVDQQLEAQRQQIDIAEIQLEERLAEQNNRVDIAQDQMRGGVQISTAQIEAAISSDDNDTKIAVEQLKQLANQKVN